MKSAAYKQSGLILTTFAQAPQTGNDADNSSSCENPTTIRTSRGGHDARPRRRQPRRRQPRRRQPRRHRRAQRRPPPRRRRARQPPRTPSLNAVTSCSTSGTDTGTTTTLTPTTTTPTTTSTTAVSTTTTASTRNRHGHHDDPHHDNRHEHHDDPTTTTGTGTTTTPHHDHGTSATPTTTTPSTTTTTPCTAPAGGQVGLLAISQYITPGSSDYLDSFNHFSLLGSIEQLFGLKRLGYAATGQLPLFGSSFYSNYTPA